MADGRWQETATGNLTTPYGCEEMYSIGHKSGKMYKINAEPIHGLYFGSVNQAYDVTLWHYRLGHLGYDNLKLLYNKSMVDGLKLNSKKTERLCMRWLCDGKDESLTLSKEK